MKAKYSLYILAAYMIINILFAACQDNNKEGRFCTTLFTTFGPHPQVTLPPLAFFVGFNSICNIVNSHTSGFPSLYCDATGVGAAAATYALVRWDDRNPGEFRRVILEIKDRASISQWLSKMTNSQEFAGVQTNNN